MNYRWDEKFAASKSIAYIRQRLRSVDQVSKNAGTGLDPDQMMAHIRNRLNPVLTSSGAGIRWPVGKATKDLRSTCQPFRIQDSDFLLQQGDDLCRCSAL